MQQLPDALAPLAAYRQFIVYKLVPDGAKTKKIPLDPNTLQGFQKGENWQLDPTKWVDAATACAVAMACGDSYGVGFLFRAEDPFFFVDIDGAWNGEAWSELSSELCGRLSGAAVEVSQSGTGLHIIGTGTPPPHGCKNTKLGLELYHEARFVALTGLNAIGSAAFDCTAALPSIVADYYPPNAGIETPSEWTDGPVPEWSGLDNDEELIAKAMASTSAASMFGASASFADLWEGNDDALALAFPDPGRSDGGTYGRNEADASLAQRLAFWTGKDCERILRLMRESALVREKWDREDYLHRTIIRAVSLQEDVYSNTALAADNTLAEELGAPKLRASSDGQRSYAESVRAAKLAQCGENRDLATTLAQGGKTARFWLDNQDRTPEELAGALSAAGSAADPFDVSSSPQLVAGYQFLSPDMQIEHFRGCVYVQDAHCVFTPSGAFLKPDQFKATFGGYVFQLDDSREKTTTNAWTAFTESQLIRFPKAATAIFRPEYETGEVIKEEGLSLVNTYVPIETRRIAGDPGKFIDLVERLLPEPRDREILLSYIAAVVQYPGVKFQWWPVLQGVEGNGKTAIISSITYAIGSRYTHCPNVSEIAKSGNKFNGWIKNRLFIGMEEVYVANRREFLEEFKTTVTNERLPIENKGVDQIMGDNRANGVMCTNHKDGVPITTDTRRYCILYTAQQTKKDLERDGMVGRYFPDLYDWLKGRNKYADLGANYGFAVVNEYLQTYKVKDEFNPATNCQTAPVTSSTAEAVTASLGSIEQEILEAVEESRPGFAGGWISSFALDRLLDAKRVSRSIPPNKRRGLLQSLGYDWHPGLKEGRVNNPTMFDAGKPRLFIKLGHISANETRPAEIVRAYDTAQSAGVKAETEATFGHTGA